MVLQRVEEKFLSLIQIMVIVVCLCVDRSVI
jgi:hypothetical protein